MSDRFLLCDVLQAEFNALHGDPPAPGAVPLAAPTPAGALPDEAKLASVDQAEYELRVNRDKLKRLHQDIHALGEAPNASAFSADGAADPRKPRALARSALCLSGGGIRSATFALGVLQSLARHGLLDKFDYLSTVSGGGFIGSWLTAWINREPDGTRAVVAALAAPPAGNTALSPEPEPIRHLREYSSYLSPRLGLFSADAWTLVAIYLRNLVLNWLVLVPVLLAFLMLPRIYLAALVSHAGPDSLWGPLARWMVFLIGVASVGRAIFYALRWMPSDEPVPNPANNQSSFLRRFWTPLMVSGFALTLFWWWSLPIVFPPSADGVAHGGGYEHARVILIFGAVVFVSSILLYSVFGRSATARPHGGSASLQRIIYALISGGVAGATAMWVSQWTLLRDTLNYACLAPPLYASLFLLAGVIYVGLASRLMEDIDREWWARKGAWVLIAIFLWLTIAPLVLLGPDWLTALPALATAAIGGGTGVFTALAGHSAKTPANAGEASKSTLQGRLLQYALILVAPIFIVFVCAGLSWLTSEVVYRAVPFEKQAAAPAAAPGTQPLLVSIGGTKLPPLVLGPAASSAGAPPAAFSHRSMREVPGWWKGASGMAGSSIGHSTHRLVLHGTGWHIWFILGSALASLGLLISRWVSINKFSLSGSYRDRIIRAYLGASRKRRTPNPFTGFDPMDNIALDQLWPSSNRESCQKAANSLPGGGRPLHVLNMALNLVSGRDLAWQQRKAESFTASPLHCGNARLGYRASSEYGGVRAAGADKSVADGAADNPVSLGTAVAVSGAAASPNMGYHSSPALGFVMALLNVRSGWWAGNPGPKGDESYRHSQPRAAAWLLAQEALGLTDDQRRYVYLSDGGHFDNLGLYEMVLRRCRYIVVSDAGQDNSFGFEDLANAVRKIYIDMGIPIDFDAKIRIFPRNSKKAGGRYCAIGTIRYSKVDTVRDSHDPEKSRPAPDGHLIYLKPALYEQEPVDIYNYAKGQEEFPHETTANQFFTESQFESYRHLGEFAMDQLCGDSESFESWDDWVAHVKGYLDLPTIVDVSPATFSSAVPTPLVIKLRGLTSKTRIRIGGVEVPKQPDGQGNLSVTPPRLPPGSVTIEAINPHGRHLWNQTLKVTP